MKRKGYTLLELVIVLTISIVLFTSTAVVIGDQIEGSKIKSTQQKIATLIQALENYRLQYNALPCPALFSAAEGSAQYGVAESSCTYTCPVGMTCSTDFVIGAVPTATLGIGNAVGIDDWDNKIVYAVDNRFPQVGTCQIDGTITVNSVEGGITNTITTNAAYVLASLGKDGFGAYTNNGTLKASCAAGMIGTDNCNNGNVFVATEINKSTDASLYFDDIVGWNTNTQALNCPAGVNNCELWLDAADICTVDYQGTLYEVSSWMDKSGNNSAATNASGLTTYNPATTYNNYPYIAFSGSQLLSIANTNLPPVSSFTEIIVFKTTNTSNAAITAAANGNLYTSTANRLFGIEGTGNVAFSIISGTTIQSNAQCGSASPYCADGYPHIATVIVDPSYGNTLYINGTVDASSRTTTTSLAGQSYFMIGGNSNWGYYNGDLMEVIVYDRVLTLNEMKAIELYLAAKWGIGSDRP